MTNTYKPEEYNSLSPYLIVPGAQQLIDLLVEIFDAKALRRYEREDGSIMHAEVKIDDSVVMIADSTQEWPPNIHMLHVYVPDVDLTYKKAIGLGCKALQEPAIKGDDIDKRGMFEDFAGNQWAVATQTNS